MSAVHWLPGTWGSTTCGTENPAGVQCDRPAIAHVLVIPVGQLNVCAPCLLELPRYGVLVADRHQFGDSCNLPGARWVWTTPASPGRCDYPHDFLTELEHHANQPEGATR